MRPEAMDASHLSQQLNNIIGQLHRLFDDIGLPNHDRESREAALFDALSETLELQVNNVTAEKEVLVAEAHKMISAIRQMESSLDDSKPRRDHDDDLRVTFPLSRCLQVLREKHQHIEKLHKERFEQVKKLVQALESYSSHLEPTFVRVALPPTGGDQTAPAGFDLSLSYVDKLDHEFTRVYEEYACRVATVTTLCENIIQLWAELGTPQAQTDGAIVKYYRDAPEQLGLHEQDVAQLRARCDKLAEEKKNREKRLRDLRTAVEALWDKLGVAEHERKRFMNTNRGCGVRQINEFEDELGRLTELKRQNLHVFVEDARFKLQELWDALYLSEDEMLEFTPAFSDVYSDALLEAHEREIARLEAVREQRAPTLALVDRHRTLVHERDELAASSQDASRLTMRGQKGEKRDPGKLLREEKMRKRIAKELPKVVLELRKTLEQWEDEWGRPFLVHGERYLDVIAAADSKPAPGPRSKTPAGPHSIGLPASKPAVTGRSAAPGRARAQVNAKTFPADDCDAPRRGLAPMAHHTQTGETSARGSPSRIPARVPLSNLKHGNNSPERVQPESRVDAGGVFRVPPPNLRAPPPKMRELVPATALQGETPNIARNDVGSSLNERHVDSEDADEDFARQSHQSRQLRHAYGGRPENHHESQQELALQSRSQLDVQGSWLRDRFVYNSYSQAPSVRQISNTSTNVSGSENWETYDDNSEPEPDTTHSYFTKMRSARGKRIPEAVSARPHTGAVKRLRGIPPTGGNIDQSLVDNQGSRIISGSEWTDEDAF